MEIQMRSRNQPNYVNWKDVYLGTYRLQHSSQKKKNQNTKFFPKYWSQWNILFANKKEMSPINDANRKYKYQVKA